MKIQWKKLIICIEIALITGIVSASLTQNSMESFASLNKPNLAPPGRLFPIVWNILYILMGIASYLVLISKKSNHNALIVYITQLIFNFFCSIFFFKL